MAINRTEKWLEEMLLGRSPVEEQQWLQFVQECPSEGLQLEFKSGLELEKPNAPLQLEQYVAGFANSDGGILVFGYKERTQEFDGCQVPGGGNAEHWVSRVLQPRVGAYLSVQPRVLEGTVRGKRVFAVATARTSALVPVTRNGKLVVFLRIGDSTISRPEYSTTGAPDYLAGDLMLGRRAIPDLRLVIRRAVLGFQQAAHDPAEAVTNLSIDVAAENVGLLFADSVRYGMVAWTKRRVKLNDVAGDEMRHRLLAAVDAQQPPPATRGGEWQLRHFHAWGPGGVSPNLGPFEEGPSAHLGALTIPWVPEGEFGRVRAALYVLSRNVEPRWHQLELKYDTTVPWTSSIVSQEAANRCTLEIGVPRPEVSWNSERI